MASGLTPFPLNVLRALPCPRIAHMFEFSSLNQQFASPNWVTPKTAVPNVIFMMGSKLLLLNGMAEGPSFLGPNSGI
jgi:hypothetical protein